MQETPVRFLGWEDPLEKGIGYIFQYSWASLVAQMVRNLPVVRETWVQSLGLEDPLEEGMAIHANIPTCRIPMDRGAWWAIVHRVAKSQRQLKQLNMHAYIHTYIYIYIHALSIPLLMDV